MEYLIKKKMVLVRFSGFVVTFLFLLIISGGCAKKDAIKTQSDEDMLRERVAMYWGYKINQEFEKSYAFEDPYYRKESSLVKYMKTFNPKASWESAEIQTIAIENGTANVGVKLKVHIPVRGSQSVDQHALINEQWVKEQGMWFHVFSKRGILTN